MVVVGVEVVVVGEVEGVVGAVTEGSLKSESHIQHYVESGDVLYFNVCFSICQVDIVD